jgi:DNA-binding response OmpR family regulator
MSAVKESLVEPASMAGVETVLVVEDEQGVRSLVCNTLATRGYRVLEAKSPLDAISIVEHYEQPIHLLLTDMVMPQMSGKVLATHIVELHPETRVLYMSGYSDEEIIRHGILEPGSLPIPKPFAPGALLWRVRASLDADRPGGPPTAAH